MSNNKNKSNVKILREIRDKLNKKIEKMSKEELKDYLKAKEEKVEKIHNH